MSESPNISPEHPSGSWSTAITLTLFALLVLVPVVFRHEPAKWRAAWVMQQYQQGDASEQEAAIESLRSLVDQRSNDGLLQRTLLEWLCENEQATEAIERCESLLQHSPKSVRLLRQLQECQCAAGRFEDAWQTLQRRRKLSTPVVNRNSDGLNETAYFRALAGQNLPLAYEEIQRAIEQNTNGPPAGFNLPLASKAVIASALLSRSTNEPTLAMPLLDQQIELSQRMLGNYENTAVDSVLAKAAADFPLSGKQESSLQTTRVLVEFRRRELAYLLTTRALLHEDLQELDRCDYDRAEVMNLGFESQEVANALPDELTCAGLAQLATAYLDTRGFVLTKMQIAAGSAGDRRGIEDLDVAVLAGHVLSDWLAESPEASKEQRRHLIKTNATVLRHRVSAHEQAGQQAAADADRAAIRALGFDPDSNLY